MGFFSFFKKPSVLLCILGLSINAASDWATAQQQEDGGSPQVLWVTFEGTVELGLSPYIRRSLETAEAENYDLVVLEVDTFGGRVDAAVEIRDALLDSKVPTVAWVNKRAISAGALISIACNKIVFAKGSTMGAATPVQGGGAQGAQDVSKKVVSYFRSEMASTAERNDRDPKIAAAMVQATEEIKGLVQEGDVLTLTDKTAADVGYSDGNADSRAELFEVLGLKEPKVTEFEINWAEQIVRFFTNPTVSGLLMSGGVLGILLELQSPGFGIPGILGVLCLALFFGAKFFVFLAGWEEVLFFLIGLGFVAIEIFAFPGVFIFAALGVACMIGALFFAGISPKIPFDFSLPSVEDQLTSVSIGFFACVIGIFLLYWLFARHPNTSPFVLSENLAAGSSEASQDSLVGQTGRLITDLRPSGKLKLGDQIYQVASEGDFMEQGDEVEISSIKGSNIFVRKVKSS